MRLSHAIIIYHIHGPRDVHVGFQGSTTVQGEMERAMADVTDEHGVTDVTSPLERTADSHPEKSAAHDYTADGSNGSYPIK